MKFTQLVWGLNAILIEKLKNPMRKSSEYLASKLKFFLLHYEIFINKHVKHLQRRVRWLQSVLHLQQCPDHSSKYYLFFLLFLIGDNPAAMYHGHVGSSNKSYQNQLLLQIMFICTVEYSTYVSHVQYFV